VSVKLLDGIGGRKGKKRSLVSNDSSCKMCEI